MDNNKKIGIITVFKTENCGSFFQAWALQKLLQYWKREVFFFDYQYEFNSWKKRYLSILKCLMKFRFKRARDIIQKSKEFRKMRSYFKIIEDHNSKVDIAIFGSDTIWNFEDPFFDRNMNLFLGEDIEVSKCSYAASVGSTDIMIFRNEERIKKALSGFENISVRDMYSYRVIKDILPNKEIDICIDPTMLIDVEEYDVFSEPVCDTSVPKKYILVYYYGAIPQTYARSIRKLSQKFGLRVVRLGIYGDGEFETLLNTPEHFIYTFKNAEYVFTNTFHGCVFSLLFHRQFLTDGYQKAKVCELLNMFSMNDRLIEEDELFDEMMTKEINYTEFDNKLNNLREQSIHYLEHAIG